MSDSSHDRHPAPAPSDEDIGQAPDTHREEGLDEHRGAVTRSAPASVEVAFTTSEGPTLPDSTGREHEAALRGRRRSGASRGTAAGAQDRDSPQPAEDLGPHSRPRARAPSAPTASELRGTTPEAGASHEPVVPAARTVPARAPQAAHRLTNTARSAQAPPEALEAVRGDTTMRSLSRPEHGPSSGWDERRIMHLEREIDQLIAHDKLAHKRLRRAEFQLNVLLLAVGLSIALGLAVLVL